MNFTTKIPLKKFQNSITYSSKILLFGSCFAENMGNKFNYFKFENVVNPFGIIFNSVSLEKLIVRCIQKKYFTENDIFFHNENWHCFEVHSEFSNPDKTEFLNSLNKKINQTHNYLSNASHIVITLGTSWVYKLLENNEIVANCHKVPQNSFVKQLLSISQIEESMQTIFSEIHAINSNCNIILTVSPVRHIKDGFVENNVSKSHLLASIYNLLLPNTFGANVNYFPSFEIMMDELRDYRFYTQDMLHPNPTAIDYIWSKFVENYLDAEAFETMKQVCDIQKALQHKPFNSNSESHLKFLYNLKNKMNTLAKKHKHIQF